MFSKILIANRGEIACRIARTARRMGIATVAVYSEADAGALHVTLCDEAVGIGPAPARQSYLDGQRIVAVARRTGAQAIHPGYGFLSEQAAFARQCAAASVVFIGPPPAAIEAMGGKAHAKRIMHTAGVPLAPGYHGACQDDAVLARESRRLGYPQLIKASAGGGGKGLRVVRDAEAFAAALAAVRREAAAAFGDDAVLIERYLAAPRHIEIQVFADCFGNIVHLYERDCSLQRRHQKVLEEAPAPGMAAPLRNRMAQAALAAARAIGYVGAGTVEFLLDADGNFYFMEMNTRLQVEHAVTEMITGQDLVRWQLLVAAGERLPLRQADIPLQGHALEARIYAETPDTAMLPSAGVLRHLTMPAVGDGVRIDTGVAQGDEVGVHYDPMIAKLIVWGEHRDAAARRLAAALADYRILGLQTNLALLRSVVDTSAFRQARLDTGVIHRHAGECLAVDSADNAAADQARLRLIAYGLTVRQRQGKNRLAAARTDGWRLNQCAEMVLRFIDGDTPQAITVHGDGERWSVRLNGVLHTLTDLNGSGDTQRMVLDGAPVSFPVIETEQTILLWSGARQWTFQWFNPATEVDLHVGQGDVRAPMPGSVIAVAVAVGDTVAVGDVLLVIEAMKMEHAVIAPKPARVKALQCAVGDTVRQGAHLIVLE